MSSVGREVADSFVGEAVLIGIVRVVFAMRLGIAAGGERLREAVQDVMRAHL